MCCWGPCVRLGRSPFVYLPKTGLELFGDEPAGDYARYENNRNIQKRSCSSLVEPFLYFAGYLVEIPYNDHRNDHRTDTCTNYCCYWKNCISDSAKQTKYQEHSFHLFLASPRLLGARISAGIVLSFRITHQF